MADQLSYPLLPQSPCLTEEQLLAYIDGQLTPAAQHEVEVHITDCAFCSDAIDGWRLVNDRSKVVLLPAEVTMAAASLPAVETADLSTPDTSKVIPLHSRRKLWLSIAASVAVIAVIATTIKLILPSDNHQLAENKEAGKQKATPVPAPSQENKIRYDSISSPPSPTTEIVIGKPEYDLDRNRSLAPVSEKLIQVQEMEQVNDIAEDAVAEAMAEPMSTHDAIAQVPMPQKEEALAEKKLATVVATDSIVTVGSSTTLYQNSNLGTSPSYTYSTAPSATTTPTLAADEYRVMEVPSKEAEKPKKTASRQKASGSIGATTPQSTSDAAKQQHPDYVQGMQLMAQKNYTGAIASFDKVLAVATNLNYADAQWQKALALIQLKRTVEAKKLLQEIIKANGAYKAKAEAELKKL